MRHMTLVVVLLAVACGKSEPKAGSERGPCYGNGTCDDGLVCRSDLCVEGLAAPQKALMESVAQGVLGKPTHELTTFDEALEASALVHQISKLADEACACKDTTCAKEMQAFFMDMVKLLEEPSKSDQEKIMKFTERMGGCMAKLANPPEATP